MGRVGRRKVDKRLEGERCEKGERRQAHGEFGGPNQLEWPGLTAGLVANVVYKMTI